MCNNGYGVDIRDLDYNPFINEKTYKGQDYKIAARIQQLRLMLLIHSRLYYYLNTNHWSDMDWDICAKELQELQEAYPEESRIVAVYYMAFKDWDGGTGAFLPFNDPWVVRKTIHYSYAKTI